MCPSASGAIIICHDCFATECVKFTKLVVSRTSRAAQPCERCCKALLHIAPSCWWCLLSGRACGRHSQPALVVPKHGKLGVCHGTLHTPAIKKCRIMPVVAECSSETNRLVSACCIACCQRPCVCWPVSSRQYGYCMDQICGAVGAAGCNCFCVMHCQCDAAGCIGIVVWSNAYHWYTGLPVCVGAKSPLQLQVVSICCICYTCTLASWHSNCCSTCTQSALRYRCATEPLYTSMISVDCM